MNYSIEKLKDILIPRTDFKLIPLVHQREAWDAVHPDLREELMESGEKYLNCQWPALLAEHYMDYTRTGSRSKFDDPYVERRHALGSLAIAECLENKGRFIKDIANGIWCLCEESTWVSPAHLQQTPGGDDLILADMDKPYIDLTAAETGALLSWIYLMLKDSLDTYSAEICRRIAREVKWRILEPYLATDRFWWMWIGEEVRPGHHVNNWTPWCTGNILSALFIIEEDEEIRSAVLQKGLQSLDVFIDHYSEDGGCDEGTTYWGHAGGALFDCLEIIDFATGGGINLFKEEKIKNIGRFIYRTYIGDDYYVNFADAGGKVDLPFSTSYAFGKKIGDERLMDLSLYSRELQDVKIHIETLFPMLRVMRSIGNYGEMKAASGRPVYIKDFWFEGIEVMIAREEEGDKQGFFLAAKGGHNDESHNHNDVGNFIVYYDGEPVFIDVGVETYTAKTFSDKRYDIWTMQSAYHNVPMVNGIMQSYGKSFKTAKAGCCLGDDKSEIHMDIAGAYGEDSPIEEWTRTIALKRNENRGIELRESFSLREATDDLRLIFMCARKPLMKEDKVYLELESGKTLELIFDSTLLSASWEKCSIEDNKLHHVWGDSVYRLLLKSKREMSRGELEIGIREGNSQGVYK